MYWYFSDFSAHTYKPDEVMHKLLQLYVHTTVAPEALSLRE